MGRKWPKPAAAFCQRGLGTLPGEHLGPGSCVQQEEGVGVCRAWWGGLFCPRPHRDLRVFALLQQDQEWARSLLSWVPSVSCIFLFPSFSIFSSPLCPRITATETVTVINSLLKINDWLHPNQLQADALLAPSTSRKILFPSECSPHPSSSLLSPHPPEGHWL